MGLYVYHHAFVYLYLPKYVQIRTHTCITEYIYIASTELHSLLFLSGTLSGVTFSHTPASAGRDSLSSSQNNFVLPEERAS